MNEVEEYKQRVSKLHYITRDEDLLDASMQRLDERLNGKCPQVNEISHRVITQKNCPFKCG